MTDVRRHDATGRSLDRRKVPRPEKIGYQFIPLPADMVGSPAYRALSLNARKALDRLMTEHAAHAGTANGRLICTYDDFRAAGVRDGSQSDAIGELVALGFVRIAERGRAGNGEFRKATAYRLTFLPAGSKPTDDWRLIATNEDAAVRAEEARAKRGRRIARSLAVERSPKTERQGHGCP